MHVKILILYQNFKALKIILFLLNFEVPLNVAFLKATQFVGTNFKDWRVQIEFDLDIMNVDLAIYEDKPAPLTYQSTEAEKLYHKHGRDLIISHLSTFWIAISSDIRESLLTTDSAKELFNHVKDSSTTADKSMSPNFMT